MAVDRRALQAVQARDRAGDRVDPRAARPGPLGPLGMIEKRAHRQNHQIAARVQDRRRMRDQRGLGRRLDDDVGALEQLVEFEKGRRPRKAGQELPRAARVAARRAGKAQAGHARRDRASDRPADRAEPEETDAAHVRVSWAPP